MNRPRIGVLALQGAVSEHANILTRLGAQAVPVRKPEHLEQLAGIIIPGGESTAIARLAAPFALLPAIRQRIDQGSLVALGTCAGLILLADSVNNSGPLEGFDRIGGLDITVDRNAYGNQLDSFEAALEITPEFSPATHSKDVGQHTFGEAAPDSLSPTVAFIRAPRITAVGTRATVLARHNGEPVAVAQDNILGATFHPEISGEPFLHEFLLDLTR